jgi:hypothetical protein
MTTVVAADLIVDNCAQVACLCGVNHVSQVVKRGRVVWARA